MRAIQIRAFGAAPEMTEIDRPTPQAGEISIDVAACGLNFADLLMLSGKYQDTPPLPFSIGMEISGTVAETGPGVTTFAPGQRVAAFIGNGGLAEVAVCAAERCVPVPHSMPLINAAGFLIAYGTSHLALAHRARLQQGETLLVLGAAGGVGLTAVEIGAAMGARVIAVARGKERLEVARAAGAAELIDSTDPELDLRGILKGLGGVDVVYDAIGEPLATPALRALRPEGRFLAIGFAGGKVPQFPANILLVKNLTVIGLYWGGYLSFAPETLTQSLRDLLDWYEAGRIRPHISHQLPFERFDEGLELLRSRSSTGKVVIEVAAAKPRI